MHNDTTKLTEITILDRAIKARARRDRDGKKRRPVVDGLIEYAQEQTAIADRETARATAEAQKGEVYRDEIAKLNAQIEDLRHGAIGVATMVSEQADA